MCLLKINMRILKGTVELILFVIFLTGCPDGALLRHFVSKIFVGHNPSEVVFRSTPPMSYITVTNDNLVDVDVYQGQRINVGNQPIGIALWQGGNRLYVINSAGLSISVIALSNDTLGRGNSVVDSITNTSFHNMGDAIVTPDGRYLYVATDTNAISVISTSTDKVVMTFTNPSFNYPTHLVADTYGRYIFVSELLGNAVSVISTTTNTVIKTIGVGISPNGIAQTPDGNWLFVVNSGSNSVSVIDVGSLTVARTVTDTSFNNPQRIALIPECAYGFVSEYNSGNVSLISQNALITGSGRAVMEDIPVGSEPYDVDVEYFDITNEAGSELFGYANVVLKGENAIAVIDYTFISEIHNACF
jgi:YVTN family beta-propeller protein